jgi:hypothetical protein
MRYWPDRLSEDLLFECFQDCQGKPDEKCDQENRYRSQASKFSRIFDLVGACSGKGYNIRSLHLWNKPPITLSFRGQD